MKRTVSYVRICAWLAAAAILLFPFSQILLPVQAVNTFSIDNEDNATKAILEMSLSVTELDKEIERIQQEKELMLSVMSETEQLLLKQQEVLATKQDEAGKILRAYYMGERDFIFAAISSFESLSEWFQVLDFIEIIFTRDKQVLTSYATDYQAIKEKLNEQQNRHHELLELENRLQEQKDRILALEKQVENQLKGRTDAERILLLIEHLNDHWNNEGITVVRQYFKALSEAMGELPAWIQQNKDLLEQRGLSYTITVPDLELNQFLKEQNPLFEDFNFMFSSGKVTAHGKNKDMEISITGHYILEETPKSGIIFHIDKLLFNGFLLPDTTSKELEKQFDLGFYPQLIFSFLKADEVAMEDGKLTIKLSIKL